MILRMFGLAGLAWFLTGFPTTSVQQHKWEVSGIIVDEVGKPLAESELSRYFSISNGAFFAFEPIRADSQGKFSGTITPYKLPMVYLAMDKGRKLGARVTLTEQSIKQPLKIVLRPLAEVGFRTEIENGYVPTTMATSVAVADPATIVVFSYDPGPYRVPAGQYELRFSSQEIQAFRKPFTVKSGEKIDLGTCALSLTPIARNVGKPAMPIDFAEARGVPPNFKMEDLKGKWVLMEFWGFW